MNIFQNKSQNAALMNLSLKEMVVAITKDTKAFEGKSDIIIDKIKAAKNNGGDGWKEINNAWGVVASGDAKRKIDKYFNKALKVVNSTEDRYLKASVKSELKSESSSDKPIEASSSGEKKVKLSPVLEKIENKFNQLKSEVKSKLDSIQAKEKSKQEESSEIKEVCYSSFDELMDYLKSGARLSERELSYLQVVMSYIGKKSGSEEGMRAEMDRFFIKIIGALHNDADKKTLLNLFQEQRFKSIYNASCRVETCAIVSLLEKQGFPKETITVIKDYLIDYSGKYLSKIKLNESEYDNYIKNIKKYSDFEVFKGVESVAKIHLIKGILSENEFTSENRKFLTELSHNLVDGRIIGFVKEKMNSDIETLQSEYDTKRAEEKSTHDKYIEEKNKAIDTGINRIKSMLVMKSIPNKIVTSVNEIINKKRNSTKIEAFSSKMDLVINLFQCKRIKANKIASDIEYYLNMPTDKLKSEIEIAKSKKTSFKEHVFSFFNDLNNRIVNFIYNVRHAFK